MIIRPRNWKEFQHYSNRRPTWIKLHRALLDDFEFHRLPVASRALAPFLWLLASEHEQAHVEADPEKLAFRLRSTPADIEAALKPLIESKFFEIASDPLATRSQVACSEREKRERQRERERETRAREDVPRGTSDALCRSLTAEEAMAEVMNAWHDVEGVDHEAMTAWLAHWSRVHGGRDMPGHQRIAVAKLLAGLGDADAQRRAVATAEANGWKALRFGDGKAPPKSKAEREAEARRESERVEWANLAERAERIGFRPRTAADDLGGYRTLVERAEAGQPRAGARSVVELLARRPS